MGFGLDLAKQHFVFPFAIDHEGGTFDSHGGLAIYRFLDPDAVCFGNGMVDIGEQRKSELKFGREFCKRFRRVRTEPLTIVITSFIL